MSVQVRPYPRYWESNVKQWVLLIVLGLLIGLLFRDGLILMVKWWINREEYSHGILIPFITLFLIYQRKNELAGWPFVGSWLGVAIVVLGIITYFLGELSALYTIIQYGFLIVLLGAVLAVAGNKIFKEIWIPLLFLFFAIPLPNFIYFNLSSALQLWSSKLGVQFIRLCDISVYLEGNVIDLGAMQLQVVEACSGLRYLFPLMSLAFMCAYFFKAAFWKRTVVFLSSIPITVLMNSFRIGVIGVLVEYWGKSMAEGFLHDFEGWIVFMACTAILVGEMWLLARIGSDPRPLAEVFGLVVPAPLPANTHYQERELPQQFWVVGAFLAVATLASFSLEGRTEVIPDRQLFSEFPMRVGDWNGRRESMEQRYIDTLKFDDYLLADYTRPGEPAPVNLYFAYYENQRKGESIHSPKGCIPGGGWRIESHEAVTLDDVQVGGQPLKVNRLVIRKEESQQLVYYWFQQRGRHLTNEYVVKWYLFWDALMKNRSDGALVRLTTFAPKGESIEAADQRLKAFLVGVLPEVERYVPN
jgi:exosortase D (VPLPA-CTERM-specific)